MFTALVTEDNRTSAAPMEHRKYRGSRGTSTQPHIDSRFSPPVNVSLFHCIATYLFCFVLVMLSVVGDLVITPYLLKLPLHTADAGAAAASSSSEHSIRAVQRLHSGAIEILRAPQESLSHIPWTATNPLGLLVFSYGAFSLLLPLSRGFFALLTTCRVPRPHTLKKRLRNGKSALGRGLVRLCDHFDDNSYVGYSRKLKKTPVACLLGILSFVWMMSQYTWSLSLRDLSLPASNVVFFTFVFIVAFSQSPPLNYSKSFFKVFCAALSWLGTCIFYFPTKRTSAAVESPELYSNADDMFFTRGFACALLASCCFAAYLLAFRKLNCPGAMCHVLGWQGVGALVGGVVLLAAAHFTEIEKFRMPSTGSDWKTLVLHVAFRALQMFALNEALRWGDAFCVATCIPVIPAVSYLLEGIFTGEDGGFIVTQSKLFAVLFTGIACGLMCSWYFLRISALCKHYGMGAGDESSRLLIDETDDSEETDDEGQMLTSDDEEVDPGKRGLIIQANEYKM